MKFGDHEEVSVKYLYGIDGLAEEAGIPCGRPSVGQITDVAEKEQQHRVKAWAGKPRDWILNKNEGYRECDL
jgi:hypothetical protein